ncbi:MAG: hypothetical protein D6734_11835, partial [Candidatus Schekmanbacteria bacterium]
MKITIIGGGFSGLSFAFYSPNENCKLTIIEKENSLGGLASSFRYNSYNLDRFYHCILSSDKELLQFISDNGLSQKIFWEYTTMGFWIDKKIFPLNTAFDLLRFSPLPFFDRIKAGYSFLKLNYERNIEKLESITAENLLVEYFGNKAFSYIWKPLLISKFGEKYSNVPATWVWGRLKRQTETKEKKSGADKTAYIDGGFASLISAIEKNLLEKKTTIIKGVKAEKIEERKNGALIVYLSDGSIIESDIIISTVPYPDQPEIVSSQAGKEKKIQKIDYQGVVCLLLICKQKLSNHYWIPIVNDHIPFAGVVETTNLITPLQNRNINLIYLMDYTSKKETFELTTETIYKKWVKYIPELFPSFSLNSIKDFFVFKAHAVEPIAILNYSKIKPQYEII